MKISVVIPAYNEEQSLPATLNSLVNQKTKYDFEVIIVDNNSTDNTGKVAKSYENKLHVKVVQETQKGRGAARKCGFAKAQGDIIASTDADTTLPGNWIESIGNFFEKNLKSIAVTALCKYPTKKISIAFFNLTLPFAFSLFKTFFGHYWLSGYSFAIKKEAYVTSGGFNAEIDGNEDSELATRVAKLGRIEYDRNITIEASDRRFKDGLLKNLVPYFKTFYNMRQNKFASTKLEDKR